MSATAVLLLRVWAERDGCYLPEDPDGAYAEGAARDIEFIRGCTKDEVGYFIHSLGLKGYSAFADDRMAKKMAQLTEAEQGLVEGFCADARDVSTEYSVTRRLFDQIVFIAPLFRMSENVTRAGGKNYTYFFTPESTVRLTRSVHAVELPGVFNHPELTESTGRAFDETFSKIMRKMWVQFATCGNPTLQADVSPDGKEHVWPLYDLEDRQAMVFDEFDIHPEKEDVRQILDWDRTYFLTRYYCI